MPVVLERIVRRSAAASLYPIETADDGRRPWRSRRHDVVLVSMAVAFYCLASVKHGQEHHDRVCWPLAFADPLPSGYWPSFVLSRLVRFGPCSNQQPAVLKMWLYCWRAMRRPPACLSQRGADSCTGWALQPIQVCQPRIWYRLTPVM